MVDPTIYPLTSAQQFQAKYLPFNRSVSFNRTLSVTFDFYAYGGSSGNTGATSGGDGISFMLIDGSKSPTQPGGTGGSLGYAPYTVGTRSLPGISGGYLGVGFDEFGFFSNSTEGRLGGFTDRRPNSIGVRGSEATNYKFLGGAFNLPQLDNPGPGATRANSRRRAKVDLDNTGKLAVSLDINLDGDFTDPGEKVLELNVITSQNGPLPSSFKFAFAASTGVATNIHEVGNIEIQADGISIPGNFSSVVVGGGNTTPDGGDVVIGADQDESLLSTGRRDILTGNGGADRFVFSGQTKREALRKSTLRRLDHITDFNFAEGDRVQLDFDGNLGTIELPRRLFNAGRFRTNLRNAVEAAFEDKNLKKQGDQRLRGNEAVFFRARNRTYLAVNDNKRGFSQANDLVVDMTGIQFKPGDLNKGALAVGNYFATTPVL
jgi:serralysin